MVVPNSSSRQVYCIVHYLDKNICKYFFLFFLNMCVFFFCEVGSGVVNFSSKLLPMTFLFDYIFIFYFLWFAVVILKYIVTPIPIIIFKTHSEHNLI